MEWKRPNSCRQASPGPDVLLQHFLRPTLSGRFPWCLACSDPRSPFLPPAVPVGFENLGLFDGELGWELGPNVLAASACKWVMTFGGSWTLEEPPLETWTSVEATFTPQRFMDSPPQACQHTYPDHRLQGFWGALATADQPLPTPQAQARVAPRMPALAVQEAAVSQPSGKWGGVLLAESDLCWPFLNTGLLPATVGCTLCSVHSHQNPLWGTRRTLCLTEGTNFPGLQPPFYGAV